jgi:hypothetical protein
MNPNLYTEIADNESFISSSRSNPNGFKSNKFMDWWIDRSIDYNTNNKLLMKEQVSYLMIIKV